MKPGTRVRAILELENQTGAFAIPRQAVFEKEGKKLVYRKKGDGFESVPIVIGSSSAGRVVVTKGLVSGDRSRWRTRRRTGRGRAMENRETFTSAFGNLATHKLRTGLTMLGMIFGVGAVIAMLSIGAGAEQKALEAIGRLGLRNVIVSAKEVKPEDRQEIRKKSLGVSLRDGEAIMEAVPNIERVLPRVEVKPYKIMTLGAKTKGKVFGVSSRYREVADVRLDAGRFFDAQDEREHAQVCVIGQEIRRNLFGYGSVLGKQLKVNDVWLEVVGVLASDPGSANASQEAVATTSTSKEIWIPVSTAMRKFDRDPLDAPVDELMVHREGRRLDARDGAGDRAAAAASARRRGRLRSGDPRGSARAEPADAADLQHRHGIDRRDLAPGRRDRDHEHHAGHACSSGRGRSACAAPSVRRARTSARSS